MAARKRWTKASEETPELLKFREKRKWQINLRRYVIQKSPCPAYAPYFGLDIENMRNWFEYQFTDELSWENFGEKWQFDHIVPVTYFDFSREEELRLCWSFVNIRVKKIQPDKDRGSHLDILLAKNYFKELYGKTGYEPCAQLLRKIEEIESSEFLSTEAQQNFINEQKGYLKLIEDYAVFEFELLNSGRNIGDVQKEIALFKKHGG